MNVSGRNQIGWRLFLVAAMLPIAAADAEPGAIRLPLARPAPAATDPATSNAATTKGATADSAPTLVPKPRPAPGPPKAGRITPPAPVVVGRLTPPAPARPLIRPGPVTAGRLIPPTPLAAAPVPRLPNSAPPDLQRVALANPAASTDLSAAPGSPDPTQAPEGAQTDPGLPRSRPKAVPPAFQDPFVAFGREPSGDQAPGPSETMVTALVAPPPVPAARLAENAACEARIAGLGVSFEPAGGIQLASVGCHVDGPLKVTSLGNGLSIAPETILNCRTTEALVLWMRDVVVPAAQQHLGAKPTGINQSSAYVCRSRNNQVGAKLSEHATGNAIDIGSIALEGRPPIEIRERGAAEGAESAFQTAVRQGACKIFNTVLGPGSDAAHATHFHFDMAQRKGGHRLCD